MLTTANQQHLDFTGEHWRKYVILGVLFCFTDLLVAGEHLANKVISARALDSFQNKVIKNRKIWSDRNS